ncbi:hypothetical protein ACMAZE_12885 [Pseudopelagicola sp. nBUS_20]|uniref:hypothetical protein n=1 Tax=Pseudopelagicola sp. nBUS_20 TaxID=3395317 RepID=UPI003EBB88F6
MDQRTSYPLVGLAFCAALSACTTAREEQVMRDGIVFEPVYQSVDTRLLEGDLVNFLVFMTGARNDQDVHQYAECAAAQYALIRGFGFARHLRTTVNFQGGIWSGDAVYTISAALPRGSKTIDAEVIVSSCKDNRIPTV